MLDIKNKSIFIIGQGTSAYDLKDKIKSFDSDSIVWASLNRFSFIEKEILSKINRKLDIVYCASNQRFNEERYNIIEFLNRKDALFVTNNEQLRINDVFNHPFKSDLYVCDFGFGFSSLFAMLCALGKLGATNIYLIGFDGYSKNNEVYFNQSQIVENFEAREQSIMRDTIMMNKIFWDYWKYIGLKPISIINMNLNSNIQCFTKTSLNLIELIKE